MNAQYPAAELDIAEHNMTTTFSPLPAGLWGARLLREGRARRQCNVQQQARVAQRNGAGLAERIARHNAHRRAVLRHDGNLLRLVVLVPARHAAKRLVSKFQAQVINQKWNLVKRTWRHFPPLSAIRAFHCEA